MENTTPDNVQDNANQSARSSGVANIQIPSITLPSGGGAIRGIQEQFQVASITGTSSLSIPIPFSPSRQGFMPEVSLNYSSGSGNGPFGLGWDVPIPSVKRCTQRKLPEYKDAINSDVFSMDGFEDLVPKHALVGNDWVLQTSQKTYEGVAYTVLHYRPRIESGHVRIEQWTRNSDGDSHWQAVTGDNVRSFYGLTANERIADPEDDTKVFRWLLSHTHDDKGNIIAYRYKQEDFAGVPTLMFEKNRIDRCAQTYIKKILYGNKNPYYLGDVRPLDADYMFQAVFDYGEHDSSLPVPKDIHIESEIWSYRPDPFSSYRAGFEQRTLRRCRRILMFHCFDDSDLPHSPYLTKSLDLEFETELQLKSVNKQSPYFSFLTSARHNGHAWDEVANHYSSKSLPEFDIQYQQHEWNTELMSVSSDANNRAPVGMGDSRRLWIDLYNEGIEGVLSEEENGWYYKSNLGEGRFAAQQPLMDKPSFAGLSSQALSIQDIEGDGRKSLVHYHEPRGFFSLDSGGQWSNFTPFKQTPNIAINDANARLIDLNGDGVADLLVTEESRLRWFAGGGKDGFALSQTVAKALDDEQGPSLLFEDRNVSVFLADMSGDGLTDIVRIRNGRIAYWPNMGYGRFGHQVAMQNAPVFDHPDRFNPSYLRLVDIDGSGTTDVMYLGNNDIALWMNNSGNKWSETPYRIQAFYPSNQRVNVSVNDFLGAGTACIVYQSDLQKDASAAIQYIDIMGSVKPGLLAGYQSNTGLEISIQYKSSTHYYLQDKKQGIEWVTRLPFPVHCVHSVRSEDKIRETVFTTTYSYRHGYYDREEREYRGFARVEQFDTEEFAQFSVNSALNVVEESLHQPPVRKVSWYHTGAYLENRKILHQCENEYFHNSLFTENVLSDPDIPSGLTTEEVIEAYRSLKGVELRTEIYSDDNSAKQALPYSTSQALVNVRLQQPSLQGAFACFDVVPAESLFYSYERNIADPRIAHSIILELDELGNSKLSASVIYPRVNRPVGADSIPDDVWAEQSKLHIAISQAFYTNDIRDDETYRLRVECESKSYELSGLSQPSTFYVDHSQIVSGFSQATELAFEQEFDGSVQKRLVSHHRNYFFSDDLQSTLPLATLPKLALPERSYQLAFTQGLVNEVYGNKIDDALLQASHYVHSEGDLDWWAQTGLSIYPNNPKETFYLPVGSQDLYGNRSFVEHDQYSLLTVKSIDPLGNETRAENDYRTLSPWLVTDPNLNRTAVANDELGAVIKSAVMGKEGANEGDTLEQPTRINEYDLFNWKQHKKPNVVRTRVREVHGAMDSPWQESYRYSDGVGNVIMTKSQAKPGVAQRWNASSNQLEEIQTATRWLANGRNIVDNKGAAIKQYEPYFSDTHEFENEAALVEQGVISVLYYDPLGRKVKTQYANNTFSKTEFDSWQTLKFDANDTVKDSQWYVDRGSPDPQTEPEPLDAEQRAAWLAAKHYDTPFLSYTDSMGRAFYLVSDRGDGTKNVSLTKTDMSNRKTVVYDSLGRITAQATVNLLGRAIYGTSAEKGQQWMFNDAMGRPVRAWDDNDREYRNTFDAASRTVSSFVKQGTQEILYSHIVYGEQLPDAQAKQKNLKGIACHMYDQSGSMIVKEVDFKGNTVNVERQLCSDYKAMINWQGLEGQSNVAQIELAAAPLLESQIFVSTTMVDALNRPTSVVLPDNSVFKPEYDIANGLAKLSVQIRGQGDFVDFLQDQDYDAKGQRQFAKYANGLITEYFYDPTTFQLVNMVTSQQGGSAASALQNLHYTFDPVGNITAYKDTAQQTHFFDNAVVEAASHFEYDAVYQLVRATGREHSAITSNANAQITHSNLASVNPLPHANQAGAVRQYTERYSYDECGNLLKVQHLANRGNWSRHYRYDYQDNPGSASNRLLSSSLPGDAENGPFSAQYQYDSRGNMTAMPHLQSMSWDVFDQLVSADLGGGGKVFYVYAANGMRTRKVIERSSGTKLERLYLGPVEIYREYRGGVKKLERNTLHVADGGGRIAQVDTKLIDVDGSDTANPLNTNLIRYQYTNHLGSATIETSELGEVISYEEYHPFGTSSYRSNKNGQNLSLKRYRFSGKEHDDETGLGYFGSRYYAPWLGRWTSSDPGGYVDGKNLFVYAGNNPVNFIDPNGQYKCTYLIARGGLIPMDMQQGGCWELHISGQAPAEAVTPFAPYAWTPSQEQPAPDPTPPPRRQPRPRPTPRRTAPPEPEPTPDPPQQETTPDPPADPAPEPEPTPQPQPSQTPAPPQQSQTPSTPSTPAAPQDTSVGEPGTWESLIPIWGSGRAAVNHFQHGNYWRGAAYTALAISDVFLVKSLAVAGGRLLFRGGSAVLARQTGTVALREGGEEVMETALSLSLREADDLAARAASLGPDELVQGAKWFDPAVNVYRLGDDWFVKSVASNGNYFRRTWGAMSMDAQVRALTRLGPDLGTDFFIRNNMLFTRSVGATGPRAMSGTFLGGFGRGSLRMRTILNDIRPRNMGMNGRIFDPALDPMMNTLFWSGVYASPIVPGLRQNSTLLDDRPLPGF